MAYFSVLSIKKDVIELDIIHKHICLVQTVTILTPRLSDCCLNDGHPRSL